MKKPTSIAVVVAFVVSLLAGVPAAKSQESEKKVVPVVEYTADLVVNAHGGIKTGARYVGFAVAGIEVNPWKNGHFSVGIASTHGGEPSADCVGDWQIADNNEAGNHVFALNCWYSHSISNVTIKAGLQDVNDCYSVNDMSGNLINSSFGANQMLLTNSNMPTMPNTGLGININWQATTAFAWQAGVFDGRVIGLDDDNKYNLKHKLSRSKGFLLMTETSYAPSEALTLKAGAFYHTGQRNWGVYTSGEMECWAQGERHLDAFASAGFAPAAHEMATASLSCGLSLTSVCGRNCNDNLSLGVASVYLTGRRWETSIELNYRYDINDHFFLSPDIQWILNPAGNETATNALVAILRLGFEL